MRTNLSSDVWPDNHARKVTGEEWIMCFIDGCYDNPRDGWLFCEAHIQLMGLEDNSGHPSVLTDTTGHHIHGPACESCGKPEWECRCESKCPACGEVGCGGACCAGAGFPPPRRDTIVRVRGETFRCESCGSNIFTPVPVPIAFAGVERKYQCNGCGERYTGEV